MDGDGYDGLPLRGFNYSQIPIPCSLLLRPVAAVEGAVLDRFGQVRDGQMFNTF